MSLLTIVLLFIAGFVSGAVNAVAGGGTFITFGVLTLSGMPPIMANATSSIAQFPGYITSTLAYFADIRRFWRQAVLLAAISGVGALGGAFLLLSLDNLSFRALVPWLLLLATVIFAAGPWLKPKPQPEGEPEGRRLFGKAVQLVVSVYGGFFGAGMGIMMLASLGITEGGDYHRLNALKNLLSIVIATVAIAVFTMGGLIGWAEALVMIPAVALGGYAGVWIARQIPQLYLRLFVIAIGVFLTGYYFQSA
ncbi:sulfite exporter TauE/SafE family protein [Devosia sp. A449]